VAWLATHGWAAWHRANRSPWHLEVLDLRGPWALAWTGHNGWIELTLPPSLYRVTAWRGEFRRDYTLALSPTASTDLRVGFTHRPR
jgi:hypothetical protein